MSHVAVMGQPLEIGQAVVALVEILVIGLFSRSRWTIKEEENETVDSQASNFSLPVQASPEVPFFCRLKAKDFSRRGSYAPEVGDLVEPFVAFDWEPAFCGRIFGSHKTSGGLWSGLRQALKRPAVRFYCGRILPCPE
jgi:hypothetical protein